MEAKKKLTSSSRQPRHEVSTALCLCDPTWAASGTPNTSNFIKKKKAQADHDGGGDDEHEASSSTTGCSSKLGKLMTSSTSTTPIRPLELLHLHPSTVTTGHGTTNNIINIIKRQKLKNDMVKRINPTPRMLAAHLSWIKAWGIRKTLTATDLDRHGNLHLPATSVADHVMGYVDDKFKKGVESNRGGVLVIVHDCDTQSVHLQSIVKLRHVPGKTGSYVFAGVKWHPAFVERRRLKEGDQIGLHWLRKLPKPMFLFSVLPRATYTADD